MAVPFSPRSMSGASKSLPRLLGRCCSPNSPQGPQGPQGTQLPQSQPPSLPQGAAQMPDASPSGLRRGGAPLLPNQSQGRSAPDMGSLAQRWLPGVPPKTIMGNADVQASLISKATNPNDVRKTSTRGTATAGSQARAT